MAETKIKGGKKEEWYICPKWNAGKRKWRAPKTGKRKGQDN